MDHLPMRKGKDWVCLIFGVSADCLEAIYNLGLVNIHIGKYKRIFFSFPHTLKRLSFLPFLSFPFLGMRRG